MSKERKSWVVRVTPGKNRVYLLKDITVDGRETYFFIRVVPEQEQAFLEVVNQSQPLDLTHFGRIVASGYGEPSEELYGKMRAIHEVDI